MFTELIILLFVALVIGSVGQSLTGFSKGGCLVTIAVGFIGALLGGWFCNEFELPDFYTLNMAGQNIKIVWSILGSIIFTLLLSIISPKRD